MTVDKAERIANLVAYLLDVHRPVTLRQIVAAVAGYPEAYDSARTVFNRDRKMLASEGIEIAATGVNEDTRYRIDPSTYYLPDLDLDADETAALNLAASAVRIEQGADDDALLKLGAVTAEGPALVSLPADARLAIAHEAVRQRRRLRFRHGDKDRNVEPYGLLCRDGFWYLAGRDLEHGEVRTFRLDRIAGSLDPDEVDGTFEVPPDFELASALPSQPFELEHGEPVEAHVQVDAVAARRVVAQMGEGAVRRRHDDGTVVVVLPVTSVDGLRSWLFGLLDHARLLGPPTLVDDVRSWLRSMA